MENLLAGYSPHAYAAMRVMVGRLFFCHGLQKVFGLFGGVNGEAAPLLAREYRASRAWFGNKKLDAAG